MRSRGQTKISVVMVSWHTGPVLFDAIRAALQAPDVHELILVNHGNPADVVERLETLADEQERFLLIHSGGNLGYSKGCNIGARIARGTHLLFLNPDAILVPGAAARMAETAQGLADPWVVGARILDRDGREQRGGRRGDLSLVSAFLGFTGLSRFVPGVRDIHREREPVPAIPVDTPCVSGAALMMSRTGYDSIGGFDETYFLHVEDIDLCRRVRQAGGRVLFDPHAELVHYGSTSHASIFFVERHKAHGLVRYFWRYASPVGRIGVALAVPVLWLALMSRAFLIAARR
ncbi:glycosyltransferase family 2 protein [Marinicauda algicola]|uniref:Glycosyltransferase family 2 protein n=1 Tax=Marinicauda algicola TaxID=2029849 RepID=A0A4S2H4C3_9PROT|nr:glycosyltransferase family 2 protein [Marinicauda algicola]TGY90500.1 glycosyltransferase family 2 protein [Marinicauda algicola]